MKTGFNLLLWTTHLTETQFPVLAKLKAAGYDGVEVPLFEGDHAHFEKIGRAIDDAGLSCTSVTVLPDPSRSAVSPDPADRQRALDHIKWAIDVSVALGSDLLCGPFHQALGVFTGAGATPDELAWAAEVHRQAADHAAAARVALAIEPLNRFECYFLNTMAAAKAYVARVDRSNFGVLYDTFHANIEEQDPVACIAASADVIRHVHISENHRGTPGKGHIDFDAIIGALRRAGYDGWLTIEAFGQTLPALQAAAKIWRPLFASEEEVYQIGLATIRNAWASG